MISRKTLSSTRNIATLTISAAITWSWLSAVVVGMQHPAPAQVETVALPLVVVVGHHTQTPNVALTNSPASAKSV